MAKKALILAALSIILITTAAFVTLAVISRASHSAAGLSAASKPITALCAEASYKDLCKSALTSGSINESSTAGDIIRAAVRLIADEVKSSGRKAIELRRQARTSIDNDGFRFCENLLVDAGDQLAAVITEADDPSRLNDLQAWLSMVMSYRTNCLASIEAEDLNGRMTSSLQNATELTDNALAVVAAVGELSGPLGLNLNWNGTARGGFPAWVSAGDRKLLGSQLGGLRPNMVVAKDGSGDFITIGAALRAMPRGYRGRYVIYVKAGVYAEQITVEKDRVNLLMYGDGPRRTVVTGYLSNAMGIGTYLTATFSVNAPGFIARSMGFSNTAGPQGHQAVALRLQSDAAVIYNCRINGFQDSFYTQSGRHFVRSSLISGTVDFIFGDSQVVLQNCLILLRRPMDHQQNTVTAHGRDSSKELTGIVIQNCRIVPDVHLYPDRFKIRSYLGRPWKRFSTTVVMESTLGDLIRPEGWLQWAGDFALDTLYYAEYNNRGPGSPTGGRVKWKGFRVIDRRQAMTWTAGSLLAGKAWIPYSGVPHVLTLMR